MNGGRLSSKTNTAPKVTASRQGRGSKPAERHLNPIGGRASSGRMAAQRPSAKQITRAEVMLELWHHVALVDTGDRKRLKRAVYLKASGMRPRAVQEHTGLNYQQLWKAQKDACSDVWEKIMQLSQLGG